MVAETKTELEEKCLAAGRLVGKEVKRLGLILSTKSKIFPENILTRQVAKILTEKVIPLDTVKTADDVGVELSGGTTRAGTTLDNRILKKGAPRADRVAGLVMENIEATKLAMSGVQPTQAYGQQAMGASKVQQKAMRKNLQNCLRFGGTASCTTTTIAWTFGLSADPFIRMPLEQIDMWAQVLVRDHSRRETRNAI